MTNENNTKLGKTLWSIADNLRGSMNADDFRDYMLSFLFLRYLSDNYEDAAKEELKSDYPEKNGHVTPLQRWYEENADDVAEFEKMMRRRTHYVIHPNYLWGNITSLAKRQHDDLLRYS
jgi:type I restriction enzyme M protein